MVNKRTGHNRIFRSVQRNLHSQFLKAQESLDDLVENDFRLMQVRVKTLRTHRLYPGDGQVQFPSLGLINEEDKDEPDAEVEETKEELIRERNQGFKDHAKVRQGYKKLDVLVKALHKQLLRFASYKERLQHIKEFEKLECIGLEPSDDIKPTVESEMMKEGATFADIAFQNIEELEVLASTEGLEKTKQGVSFAAVVAGNMPEGVIR
ncbi:hypothetical protein BGZ58_004598 [Dissophora ornata]|nr:hypothetical protein BGZ58_004598 [Dissophora ornata]